MSKHSILILPGLDGTTRMLSTFRDSAPTDFEVSLVDLPVDLSSYDSLVESLADTLSDIHSCTLIAESFSGPLALMLASRYPQSIARMVLVASFVSAPLPNAARFFPWSLLFKLPMLSWAARYFLLGQKCDSSLVDEFKQIVRTVPKEVLAGRIRQVLQADVRNLIRELPCPVMYLRPSQDRLIPKRCVNEIRRLRADAVVHEIEGPHLILETRPKEAWEKIDPFIRSS